MSTGALIIAIILIIIGIALIAGAFFVPTSPASGVAGTPDTSTFWGLIIGGVILIIIGIIVAVYSYRSGPTATHAEWSTQTHPLHGYSHTDITGPYHSSYGGYPPHVLHPYPTMGYGPGVVSPYPVVAH